MKIPVRWYGLFLFACIGFKNSFAQETAANATLKITFINTVNNLPLVLDSVSYTNNWNEAFTISKLKYYISNVQLLNTDKKAAIENNSYHLINEEDTASKSFSFSIAPGSYSSLSFLIGVDSIKNVSGAQTDALDPLNGMFWTWNTGYIMFKLEGNSPQSTLVNNKIEYHIGGFGGANSVLRKVGLPGGNNAIHFAPKKITEVFIKMEASKIWNAVHQLKITGTPGWMTPGAQAAAIADNYAQAFEIIKIVQY